MLMTEKKRNERKCAKAIRAEGRGAGLTEKKKPLSKTLMNTSGWQRATFQ